MPVTLKEGGMPKEPSTRVQTQGLGPDRGGEYGRRARGRPRRQRSDDLQLTEPRSDRPEQARPRDEFRPRRVGGGPTTDRGVRNGDQACEPAAEGRWCYQKDGSGPSRRRPVNATPPGFLPGARGLGIRVSTRGARSPSARAIRPAYARRDDRQTHRGRFGRVHVRGCRRCGGV
jgi:hypothetical protein